MTDIDLSTLMLPGEAEAIGVEGMTASQKNALASWGLRMYALGEVIVASIADVKYGGHLILLDDGSRWEVDEMDDIVAESWLQNDRVVVVGGEMLLLDESEKVSVRREDA